MFRKHRPRGDESRGGGVGWLSYAAGVKHLHYAGQVLAVGNTLAQIIQDGAAQFANAGRSTTWPIACYRDEREDVAQVLVGPGIPILITAPWLDDERSEPRHTNDSEGYITSEVDALESDDPLNVVVYGRYERSRGDEGEWQFTGLPGIEAARSVGAAVRVLNDAGYEVVASTESGAPGETLAWSNLYLIARLVRSLQ